MWHSQKTSQKYAWGGGAMTYYSFSKPALNTFSPTLAKAYQQNSTLLDTIQIQVQSLEQILDSALPKNTHIDFLSIDVEGLDREVLESNNWDKYQPKVILIESPEKSLESLVQNPIYQFLKALDYELYAKTMRTLIFKKSINTTSDRLKVS